MKPSNYPARDCPSAERRAICGLAQKRLARRPIKESQRQKRRERYSVFSANGRLNDALWLKRFSRGSEFLFIAVIRNLIVFRLNIQRKFVIIEVSNVCQRIKFNNQSRKFNQYKPRSRDNRDAFRSRALYRLAFLFGQFRRAESTANFRHGVRRALFKRGDGERDCHAAASRDGKRNRRRDAFRRANRRLVFGDVVRHYRIRRAEFERKHDFFHYRLS